MPAFVEFGLCATFKQLNISVSMEQNPAMGSMHGLYPNTGRFQIKQGFADIIEFFKTTAVKLQDNSVNVKLKPVGWSVGLREGYNVDSFGGIIFSRLNSEQENYYKRLRKYQQNHSTNKATLEHPVASMQLYSLFAESMEDLMRYIDAIRENQGIADILTKEYIDLAMMPFPGGSPGF